MNSLFAFRFPKKLVHFVFVMSQFQPGSFFRKKCIKYSCSKINVKNCSEKTAIQRFSIPAPIILYICTDTKPSPQVLDKLYATCKYFWPKIKILPVYAVIICDTTFGLIKKKSENGPSFPLPIKDLLHNYDFKLFINRIGYENSNHPETRLISTMVSKWYLNLETCDLFNQHLTFEEYKILVSDLGFVSISQTKVFRYPENSIVPMDVLYSVAPKLRRFDL